MKLLHIADLHIGKRVHGMSMIPEQLNAIEQLRHIAVEEGVSAVLIAGDVFDRPVPSREALEVCEAFFSAFCGEGIEVFVVPGNHDSPQQLAFCSALLAPSGLHIAKAFDGSIERHDIEVDGERVSIHLLPFVRPTDVRMALPEEAESISSHDDAVRSALSRDRIDQGFVNVLVAHQFVTSGSKSPQTCDSEVVSVGGTDNVDASAFDAYDYVALGHLHGPQHVGCEQVRYAGSPVKYSFSEVSHSKGATLLTIEDGEVAIEHRELSPLHDMREITASYAEIAAGHDEGDANDYMRVTLTDKSLPDAMAKLRAIYPNILRLDWRVLETPTSLSDGKIDRIERESPLQLFEDYYEQQMGESLSDDESRVVEACFEECAR